MKKKRIKMLKRFNATLGKNKESCQKVARSNFIKRFTKPSNRLNTRKNVDISSGNIFNFALTPPASSPHPFVKRGIRRAK